MKKDYIIFILWGKALPDYARELIALFKTRGIGVIPLDQREFSKYRFDTHRCVLSITTSIKEQKHKMTALNSFLGFAVKRGNITLYDVSSYSNFKEDLECFGRYYKFFSLPVNRTTLVELVVRQASAIGVRGGRRWSGGRSSKLPYDVHRGENDGGQ